MLNTRFGCEFLTRFFGDLSSVLGQIGLSSDEDLNSLGAAILVYLADPVSKAFEAGLRCAVVGNYNSVSLLVISLGNSAEALLAGCVPDLQTDHEIPDLYLLALEVDAD